MLCKEKYNSKPTFIFLCNNIKWVFEFNKIKNELIDEIILVINPNDEKTRQIICTWLGGLKTSKSREKYTDHGIRYPKGKEYITGIDFEPWHFRYVGKEAATIIMDNEITLEEFVESISE